MNLANLDWEEGAELHLGDGRMFKGKWTRYAKSGGRGMGIDPGRNLGIAVAQDGVLSAWSITLSSVDTAKEAIEFGRLVATAFGGLPTILEDAAPSKIFYQVPLAEIRFGLQLGLEKGGATVTRLRPNSIRKIGLGKGTARATDAWPPLSEHAADAALMALVAAGYRLWE